MNDNELWFLPKSIVWKGRAYKKTPLLELEVLQQFVSFN
jgi:hypothetical protein